MNENQFEGMGDLAHPDQVKEALRPVLTTLARVMISDRRAVALLSPRAETLLLNQSAKRIGISQDRLTGDHDWPALCQKARRAGRTPLSWQAEGQDFDGELIFLPIDPIETFYLRLSESDHEAMWLRNRARAANLMRVAHDLRTPIQALLASSQGLISNAEDQHPPHDREELRRAAELSLDQINAILATIRGESRVKGVQPDDNIQIANEAENLVAMLAPIAASRSTTIDLTIDAPEGLILRGPLRHLRALFQNLLDNSVNHGGGKVSMQLACQPLQAGLEEAEGQPEIWAVTLELADEGGGLPAAQRDRLHAALAGHNGDNPVSGQGLSKGRHSAGMNVLAHALEQLGGKLEIHDLGPSGLPLTTGQNDRVIGTLFKASFSLPRAGETDSAAASPPRAAPQSRSDELAGKVVLMVEDSPSARDWLKYVLEAAGAEVFAVGSGPEALALLSRDEKAQQIDLILSDVTLPHMSGIELCARIRRGDPTATQNWDGPIIGLTAHADDRIREAGLRAGMTLVLEKPIQPRILVERLAEVFQGQLPQTAPPTQLSGDVIDQSVVQTLTDQMGPEATQGFMMRALSEAQMVMTELESDGIVADSGRRLHAATGACGLTGLRLVVSALRKVEKAVEKTPDTLPRHLKVLANALAQTRSQLKPAPK